MRFYSAQEKSDRDQRAINEGGQAGYRLMRRAARGMAERLHNHDRLAGRAPPSSIFVACGKGNNGGDGFVVAEMLHRMGWRVEAWLAGRASELQGEAAEAWRDAKNAGVVLFEKPSVTDWPTDVADLPLVDVAMDALLGIGSRGEPHGVVAAALRTLRAIGMDVYRVAIDIPTGMDPETGVAGPNTFCAHLTLVPDVPAQGLAREASFDHAGSLEIISLGIPESDRQESDRQESDRQETSEIPDLINRQAVQLALPRRSPQSHKGTFGHVLVVGGSPGFTGAMALAGLAALRAGAGLVSIFTPASMVARIASVCPELMVHGGPENRNGGLAADALDYLPIDEKSINAVVIGPGMGNHPDTMHIARRLMMSWNVPVLLDADALNSFEGRPQWFCKALGPVVLTPHPGEAARLLSMAASEVQADRRRALGRLLEESNATVALKGSGTLTGSPGQPVRMARCGNPGMATAGSGDVLAGLIGGLIAQGMTAREATDAGVYVHGIAGDFAAYRLGECSVTATSILDHLPAAFRWVGTPSRIEEVSV